MKRERGGSQKSFWSAPACGLIGNGIQKQRDKQQQLQQRKPLQMSKHKCDQSTTLHRSPQVLNGLGETLSGSQSTPTNRGRLANGTQVHFPALTGEAKDCGKSWERSHNAYMVLFDENSLIVSNADILHCCTYNPTNNKCAHYFCHD